MRFFFIGVSFLMIMGCSSAERRTQEFNEIEIGMVKSRVMEVAGPPHWSDRHAGMTRWIYYLKPEDKQTERVVYFRHGKVFQKGQRIKPVLTAEERDEINRPRSKIHSFQPSMTEAQMREAIKREVRKEKKRKEKEEKKYKFEAI